MAAYDPANGRIPAARRQLKIYATDPMPPATWIRIDVADEPLAPGPVGERLHVIDYDSAHKCYYPPVDLEDRELLVRGGLDPTEADPRFHQQMAYGVAMRTLENFEMALGRRLTFDRPLRILPHAFYGANAFFEPTNNAILFGYFRADDSGSEIGRNLPGQNIYTCLSHDIIAHELSHAILHRLRRYFIEPSNADVLGFHEAFADIVALFQHFTFEEMLRERIASERTDLERSTLLVGLAQQFGYATGRGRPLRSAIGDADRKLYANVFEPHARGAVLVAAVFDAYFETYRRRIADLIRIASGGNDRLPDTVLHPDLANRVAREASEAAQRFLAMCIRGFDYLPPVDVTFGDYLRAMVTADFHISREDRDGARLKLIEAFRKRGIYPELVHSLAEDSLMWEPADASLPLLPERLINEVLSPEVRHSGSPWRSRATAAPPAQESSGRVPAAILTNYAKANATKLGLDPALTVSVRGFHPSVRLGEHGIVSEIVVQLVQTDESRKKELGGIAFRGGCTLVIGADGIVRYCITKPIAANTKARNAHARAARARLERQAAYMHACDARDVRIGWWTERQMNRRMAMRMNLSGLCGGGGRW